MLNKAQTSEDTQGSGEAKRCGWLCRITRIAVGVVATALGGPIGSVVGTYLASQISFKESFENSGLNILEEEMLSQWFNDTFLPKYESLIKKGNLIFESSNIATQLQRINGLNNEIALVRAYLINDKNYLSDKAVSLRNDTCTNYLLQIEKIVLETVKQSETEFVATNVRVTFSQELLEPLYTRLKFEGTATNYSIATQNSPIDIILAPIDDIPKEFPKDEIPKEITDQVLNKAKSFPWWAYALATFGLYKVIKK